MEQKKIDWTLDVISRLREEGIGDAKRLDEIQYDLEHEMNLSDRDLKYLKKHHGIWQSRAQKEREREKTCSGCGKELGMRKSTAKPYWGLEGKICPDCKKGFKKNTLAYFGSFVCDDFGISKWTSGNINLQKFDKSIVLLPIGGEYLQIHAKRIKEMEIADVEIASRWSKKTKKVIELKFKKDGMEGTALIQSSDIEKVCEHALTLMPSTSKKSNGRVIKEASAHYYGGHKAYLAGGKLDDAQNGTLILTEKYLIFSNDALRESKRWQIKIPLDRVILKDWKVDEKVRRKTLSGGGAAMGSFVGGGGMMHESGKAHDIVVPYVDENGIEQAPRFGISSLSGGAIKEWAKLLYDTLVSVQKQKQARTQNTEKPKAKSSGEERLGTKSSDDPLKVLKLRLAKGEITKEEFKELRELLE